MVKLLVAKITIKQCNNLSIYIVDKISLFAFYRRINAPVRYSVAHRL